MRGEGLKDREPFFMHLCTCPEMFIMHAYSHLSLLVTHTTYQIYIECLLCTRWWKDISTWLRACGLRPEQRNNTRHFNSTVVTVSQHYLVNKASSVDRETFEGWWESSLGKMNLMSLDSSPKMAQGNIPLSDSLVIFRYSLSFFTNYIDLSWGKDWYCEYITFFKNLSVCKWNSGMVPAKVCRQGHENTSHLEDFTAFKSSEAFKIIAPTMTKSWDLLQEQKVLNVTRF